MAGASIDYTDREVQIIRATYPDYGAKATVDALKAEGYTRSLDSVRMKAKSLGVKRDMSKRHTGENVWGDDEIAALEEFYPTGGAQLVKERLSDMGYDRTEGAISTRATMLGIKLVNTKRRMARSGDKRIVNFVLDTRLDAEIIERLDSQRNRSDYIRRLVKEDIERSGK
jgi:hypothetical protein